MQPPNAFGDVSKNVCNDVTKNKAQMQLKLEPPLTMISH